LTTDIDFARIFTHWVFLRLFCVLKTARNHCYERLFKTQNNREKTAKAMSIVNRNSCNKFFIPLYGKEELPTADEKTDFFINNTYYSRRGGVRNVAFFAQTS
jgi:hypothetical protein